MTYKELVDSLKQIAYDHKMIVDFGYGELSDIKVKSEDDTANNQEADYPYMFLNPTQHNRDQNSIVYNFNLIMMDMAKDDKHNTDVVRIQSECQQYIDDVLSQLYFEMDSVDVNLNVTLTPFKERFQDNVAGMTASLAIVVPQGLDRCIAPFEPEPGDVKYYGVFNCFPGIPPANWYIEWPADQLPPSGSILANDGTINDCYVVDVELPGPYDILLTVVEEYADCDACQNR